MTRIEKIEELRSELIEIRSIQSDEYCWLTHFNMDDLQSRLEKLEKTLEAFINNLAICRQLEEINSNLLIKEDAGYPSFLIIITDGGRIRFATSSYIEINDAAVRDVISIETTQALSANDCYKEQEKKWKESSIVEMLEILLEYITRQISRQQAHIDYLNEEA